MENASDDYGLEKPPRLHHYRSAPIRHHNALPATWHSPQRLACLQTGNHFFNQHLGEGRIWVKTIGDLLAEFRLRPEHKSLAPDGTPATSRTKGLLQRRPVESAPVLTDLVGKAGNELEERTAGVVVDPDDYRSRYGNRDNRWTELVPPILRQLGAKEVMRRTGRKKSAVCEVRTEREERYQGPAVVYRDAAVGHTRTQLVDAGFRIPRHPLGVLYRFK